MNQARNEHMDSVSAQKRTGNTVQMIYSSLRQDILIGTLPSGALLPQLTIARRFGTSRAPVREALQRLEQEQLIVARANQRYTVAEFDVTDYENLLCLTLINMTFAIRLCVPLLTEQQLDQISKCVASMNGSMEQDPEARGAFYRKFTMLLVAPAGRRTLALISHFMDNLQRYRSHALNKLPEPMFKDGAELVRLVDAVRTVQPDLAANLYTNYFGRLAILILAGAAPSHNAMALHGTIAALTPNDVTSKER
ncbi:GntR family transcriptional regulator [Glaciimonas sp. PAMC28666]|uniref:GntR family transcriptional regulator n=1 Tax=Glaciimonas sp. PAMC28666 TaxID=2807626 RepID=UPI0019653980|nr:GntR family transcriptional regulator [Glaciimonas sp. PAMC28666]QRX81740.1 GntR family transcriptional regulator [Glaciimonas sp. PAMC28666]